MSDADSFDYFGENVTFEVRLPPVLPGQGTAIPTALIHDERMSYSARGLGISMHRDSDGRFTVADAMRHATREEALAWFAELIEYGYVRHVFLDTYELVEAPIRV